MYQQCKQKFREFPDAITYVQTSPLSMGVARGAMLLYSSMLQEIISVMYIENPETQESRFLMDVSLEGLELEYHVPHDGDPYHLLRNGQRAAVVTSYPPKRLLDESFPMPNGFFGFLYEGQIRLLVNMSPNIPPAATIFVQQGQNAVEVMTAFAAEEFWDHMAAGRLVSLTEAFSAGEVWRLAIPPHLLRGELEDSDEPAPVLHWKGPARNGLPVEETYFMISSKTRRTPMVAWPRNPDYSLLGEQFDLGSIYSLMLVARAACI